MIPKYIIDGMDFNAWGEQGRDYEALKNGTTWNKIVHWMADYDADHPYSPVRVFEAMIWEQTETCQFLRNNTFKLEFPTETPKEQKQIEGGKGWSLPNIPKNVDVNSLIPKFKGFKK